MLLCFVWFGACGWCLVGQWFIRVLLVWVGAGFLVLISWLFCCSDFECLISFGDLFGLCCVGFGFVRSDVGFGACVC